MLVLMQKPGETVIITLPDGTDIRVTVIATERGRSRMGYDAPRNIAIDREKIYRRKHGIEVNGNV